MYLVTKTSSVRIPGRSEIQMVVDSWRMPTVRGLGKNPRLIAETIGVHIALEDSVA
jgi:hypothetical protein